MSEQSDAGGARRRRGVLKAVGATTVGLPVFAAGTAAADSVGDYIEKPQEDSNGVLDMRMGLTVEYEDFTLDPLCNQCDADYGHLIRFSSSSGLLQNGEKSSSLNVLEQSFTLDGRYDEMVEFNFDTQDIGMTPAPRTDTEEFYRTALKIAIEQVEPYGYISDAQALYEAAVDIGNVDDSDQYRTWGYSRGTGDDADEAKHSSQFAILCNDGQSGRVRVTNSMRGEEYFSEDEVTLTTDAYVDYDGSDVTLRKYKGV